MKVAKDGGVSTNEQTVVKLESPAIRTSKRRTITRLGFVSLVDAAPFFVAQDNGFFAKYGLNVTLSREVGWATIREKILYGELEAAHSICPMPMAATLGMNSIAMPCVTGMILNRGGNAIILSEDLWKRGVRDGKSLHQDITNRRHFRKYIFATVFPCSTHAFILRDWFKSVGIDPDIDIQMVTLPPSQMCRNLAAGTIDGFCAGDPWTSLAIAQETGWSPACSVDICPDHPEKALMVKESFAEDHNEEHLAVIAALYEACAYCDDTANHESIARSMASRNRVNCDYSLIMKCLSSQFDYGMGRVERKPGYLVFNRFDANRPTQEQADWVAKRISSCGPDLNEQQLDSLKRRVFREDLYDEAIGRIDSSIISKFPPNPIKDEHTKTINRYDHSCG
ncbi:ABC transporter substrate-binding protein [Puniceicoccaceae bacterium K14]|nr:ABC transporter substrate-binding protein [Puniceicoccaceae bacterium K14]